MKILLVLMILSLACAVGATPPKYSVAGNVITVPTGGSVQAAVSAAVAAFAATGKKQYVIDYVGGPYTPAAGVTVITSETSAVPISDITRTPYNVPAVPGATSGSPFGNASCIGVGSDSDCQFKAVCSVSGVQFVFSNLSSGTSGASAPGNDIRVRCVVHVNNAYYKLLFGGRQTGTILWKSVLKSDPLVVSLSAGTYVECRTHVDMRNYATSASTDLGAFDKLPYLSVTAMTSSGYSSDMAGYIDLADTSSFPASGASNEFAPLTMLGWPTATAPPNVVGVGDSILTRTIDNRDVKGTIMGMVTDGNSNTLICEGCPGSPIELLTDTDLADTIPFGSVVVCEFGINDLYVGNTDPVNDANCVADVEALYIAAWQQLQRRGCQIFQTLITPACKLVSGNTMTAANETEKTVGLAAALVSVNAWIQTQTISQGGPLTNYIDVVTPVTSLNGSSQIVWNPIYTYQPDWFSSSVLVHPNSDGCILMAKAIYNAIAATAGLAAPFNSGFITAGSGPLPATNVYWEPSPTNTTTDFSRYANTATVTGTHLSYSTSPNRATFSSTDTCVKYPMAFNSDEAFSAMAWIKPTAVYSQYILSFGTTGVPLGMIFASYGSSSNPTLQIYGATGATFTDSGLHVTQSAWNLVGFSYDTSVGGYYTSTVYCANAVYGVETPYTFTPSVVFGFSTLTNVWIGAAASSFTGDMGQVMIMRKSLGATTFSDYYNATKSQYGL